MEIFVGDVVFVKNDKTKGSFSKIGIIQGLVTGQDGYTRADVVKVPSGGRSPKLLTRTLQHLVPIEVRNQTDVILLYQLEKDPIVMLI